MGRKFFGKEKQPSPRTRIDSTQTSYPTSSRGRSSRPHPHTHQPRSVEPEEMLKNVNVQRLLQVAQLNAQDIIDDARDAKVARLKMAKKEAESELLKYKEGREKRLNELTADYDSERAEINEMVNKAAHGKIVTLQNNAGKKKDKVIEKLVQLVCDIKPQLHPNFLLRKKFDAEYPEDVD